MQRVKSLSFTPSVGEREEILFEREEARWESQAELGRKQAELGRKQAEKQAEPGRKQAEPLCALMLTAHARAAEKIKTHEKPAGLRVRHARF